MLDERQRVVLFNPAAEEVLHIPAAYALQQPLDAIKAFSDPHVSPARAERQTSSTSVLANTSSKSWAGRAVRLHTWASSAG